MPPSLLRPWYRLALALALAATSVTVGGCAEPRAPINRVQPGAIARSVLEGEGEDGQWYYQQTVIDSPYSAGYTFVGEQGDLERIRWEIQQDYLIARRAYEHIAGSEAGGISGDGTELGAPIAMYRITSHFDIRHDYNPLTGERLNILVENSSDRPWYERDYIRVDWSQNLITNADFLVLARVFDGIQTEPVAYDIRTPNHPHAPRFEARDENGVWRGASVDVPIDGDVEYIDIVNKLFVRPGTVEIEGLGPVPSCFMLYQDHYDCAPGEVTVRNSFLRVNHQETDYQPMVYTGDRMERFGYFVSERAGYDSQYGVVEPARFRFVNRHNLWMESHRKDAAGNLVACFSDEECGGGGSVCDLDLARANRHLVDGRLQGACTIPYRERTVRPIAYHVSANFPESLDNAAQHLSDEWNRGFQATVNSLRELECVAEGGEADACAAERERPDAQHIFVLCHNPVRDTDHEACGPRGVSARPGDLRYSMIGWVSDPHRSSPLGYGPSSADPLTGEIVMANAFIYGAAMETLTSFATDIIRVLNGDLTETQIADGAQVEAWLARQTGERSRDTGRTASDHAIEVDGLDASRINEAMDFSWARGLRGSNGQRPSNAGELVEAMRRIRTRLANEGAFGNGVDQGTARLSSLVGSDIEQMMTTREMRLMAGIDPSLPVSTGVLDMASPLRGNSLPNLRGGGGGGGGPPPPAGRRHAEFADDSLLGLAREIAARANSADPTMEWYGISYPLLDSEGEIDYQLVREMLRQPIFDAVTAHEVGHTIGLRHNFSGSYDALNYRPGYWDLRDDGTMAPRAWDPLTQAEIDGRIVEYQYSTVMDYGVNFVVTDSMGIGHYDYAAIKMGYGDLVEVFDTTANTFDIAWFNFIQRAGWPVPLKLEAFTTNGEPSAYTYTDWPALVGGRENLQRRADVPYTSLRAHPGLRFQGISDPLVDQSGRPAVPYMFCSDEQADLNPDCLRYDQGADAYESLQSVIDNYWNYYIFNNFRRQRLGFSPESVATRVYDRYFEKVQRANQIYALYRSTFEELFAGSPNYDQFWTRPDGMGAWTVAVGAGFQLLTRVVTAPEPGDYTLVNRGDGTTAYAMADWGDTVATSINSFDGRAMETTWDFDAGYFWFDQLDRVGYFYDKIIALQVLVDPTTYFLGRDTDSDIRRYQINFGSSFGPALTSFMRGIVANDWSLIGPRPPASSRAAPRYPDPLQLELGNMSGTPIDPNASFSIQLYAAVYGMAFIPQTYDQTFLNRSRIFVRGSGEEVTFAPGTPIVEFTDPASGLQYVAASFPTPEGETGVGAAMLEHANALLANGATTELRSFVDNIDVVRRLTWRYGFGAQP